MRKKIFNQLKDTYETFRCRKGTIELTTGKYELFVYARLGERSNIEFDIEVIDKQVCSYLPKDIFDIKEQKNGFLLKANVESNEVKFHWVVK